MKFGACCGADIERVRSLKAIGYDYAEGSCGQFSELSDAEFENYFEEFKKIGFPMPVANGFFPGRIKLAGPESDKNKIADYLEHLFARTDKLGITKAVFGSGGARQIPEGMSLEKGIDEIIWDLKNIICPIAASHNVTVVIEPLRVQECNIINTVRDGVEIVEKAGISNLKVLADVYHMVSMNESFEYLENLNGILVHAHTSNPVLGDVRRIYPAPGDGFDQAPFIRALAKVGVETCSIESGTDDFRKDAAAAFPVIKSVL